jgi:thiol:disulfide interchange protein/DsbC/DsbD-like thiol-disulfide interchange protein
MIRYYSLAPNDRVLGSFMCNKLMKTISMAILILLLSAAPALAKVVSDTPSEQLQLRLIIDMDAVVPGNHLRAGVCMSIEKDWHIYWTNPGDAGIPTKAVFSGPEGFNFSRTKYPAPRYFGAGTPLAGYGYENQVMLHADLVAPETVKDGQVTLKARVSWLACKNKCIPGEATLTATLPVAEQCGEGADYNLFETCASNVPVDVGTVEGLSVSGLLDSSAYTPDSPFEALFVVKAPPQKKLAPLSDKHVPAFIPVAHENYEIKSMSFPALGSAPVEEIVVRVKGATWPGEAPAEKIGGVFQLRLISEGSEETIRFHYDIDFPRAPAGAVTKKIALPAIADATATSPQSLGTQSPAKSASLLWMILLGFIGGIILNIMPCVLPVVSIKVMSLIKQADMDRRGIRAHGLSYTAGILASFLALAVVVAIFKSGGEAVGWGFQFQSPLFVSILAAIVFVFGLSLLGVFELTTPVDRIARIVDEDILSMIGTPDPQSNESPSNAVSGLRLAPSFANGVFATVLATPCTAPFLGVALGFAFTQPIFTTFVIFFFVGLGLAFPFLILAFVPAWTRFMPKPGNWMVTFKSLMGFLLMATVAWLLDVLGKQVGAAGLTRMIVYLTILGLAAWIFGRFGNIMVVGRTRVIAVLSALMLMVGGGVFLLRFDPVAQAGVIRHEGGIAWERFSEKRLAELSGAGRTVFIDFTAAWCWTCKVNEKAVIETDEVRQTLEKLNIAALKGDWTNRDAEITEYLKKRGKAGVPLYVIIAPGQTDNPVVLPEVITKDMLIKAFEKAAKNDEPASSG